MEKQIKAPEQVLEELGIMLDMPREAVGNYVSHVRVGNLIFTSGQGVDDFHGKLGKELTEEEGYQAARQSMINLLRVLKAELGELSRVKKIVKILGMVNSAENFTGQPKVLNGASDLLVNVFGERGRHARSAVGMAQLPNNTAIEIEMIVEIQD
ncbi:MULTISPECIES: RidA family protein [Peribacillus]|jgi:enamine deaminase RidA (YjgF/YER057c/UK114 family)|uniref:RidA family protein n=1 Tax=Peribacillus TaxID=2675229 RepID=UPI000B642202|nr:MULTISPECIES: RidA family protein [Peribacillus]MDF9761811.1 enamine deaminase RidA (YjgF/YER057c/UK114 family) [Peribacillus simplex]MDV7764854.1 RidA family protein [Peribacillus sp. CSMR9]MDW7615688.1 RidA family protein [Peribacillus simplex]SNT20617.1 Enamine deaminase RidA, house cleaning of reactive enamine intermediates, YjgF/YER057c/UK114 family [Bacillus sp. OK838]